MSETWLRLREGGVEVRPDGIAARAQIPADSPFFSGHFPDNPVVPGIALLALVKLALAAAAEVTPAAGGREVVGFKRVKFRRIQTCGGEFAVRVELREGAQEEALRFSVSIGGELLCDGLMLAPIGGGLT